MSGGIRVRGARFLWARRGVVVRLGGWSVLETGQTFVTGYAPARALDAGFLAGRADVGLAWLAVAGLAVVVGAVGTGRVYAGVAALAEPLRDRLVEGVVERGVREADDGVLSALTQQVEIARDTFAGLVMVSRSFVFTVVGALVGLFSLAPPLLLVVGPPLLAGVALFAASLRPLARRQEAFLVADEALAGRLGDVCPGLRDITAAGAEERVAADAGEHIDAELRAARSLARWGVLRVASLAIGGQFPIVLLLAAAPWLLARGVTTGAVVGALAYLTQSLLPALRNLVHGLGTSGSRLTVVLRRLTSPPAPGGDKQEPPAQRHHPTPHTPGIARTPALSLTSLTFAYSPTAVPVIDNLGLTLPPAPTWPSSAPAASASPRSPLSSRGCWNRVGARSGWAGRRCRPPLRPGSGCSSPRRRTSSPAPSRTTSPICGRTPCRRRSCARRPTRWGSARCSTRSADPAPESTRRRSQRANVS